MTILTKPLRRQLETTIKRAREIAEDAAKEAIARMGVAEAEAPARLSHDNKVLRRRLRAHARTLGDTRDAVGPMGTARLQDAASYEIWHRMLFGRFLAERGLLIHPELGVAMSVAELRDLAKEESAADEWALAERYAAPGLPGIFKPDDPVLALPIAPEFSKRLRALLSGLPEEVFSADDSLGWTYEYWRGAEKLEIDERVKRGAKVQSKELPAKTQLFTEPYMVKFLLHNTLGAWWAGKVLAADPSLAREEWDEDGLRAACALPAIKWEFLRFVRDGDGFWRPAAGTFPGWPTRAAEITYCDPCCGSGHFLVEAFAILAALRQREEGLSAGEATVAVLRDNLHGLELDGRCVQIAAFSVALAAWKLAGASISIPSPHIAWVGAPPPMSRTEMASLADGDTALRRALETLHDQFSLAPLLGSLLEVGARDLLDADLRERGDTALAALRGAEPERAEGSVAARELLDAAAILANQYTLIATNVPFLGRGKQEFELAAYIERNFEPAKADLATSMLYRMNALLKFGGTIASVVPQGWLTQPSYSEFLLKQRKITWNILVRLGEHAFQSPSAAGAFVVLFIGTPKSVLPKSESFLFADGSKPKQAEQKAALIRVSPLLECDLKNSFNPKSGEFEPGKSIDAQSIRISEIATSSHGLGTFDSTRFTQNFWEQMDRRDAWMLQQSTPERTSMFSGCTEILRWENGIGSLFEMMEEKKKEGYSSGKWKAGSSCWGRRGILISLMRSLPATLYLGEAFDPNAAAIIPIDEDDLVPRVVHNVG